MRAPAFETEPACDVYHYESLEQMDDHHRAELERIISGLYLRDPSMEYLLARDGDEVLGILAFKAAGNGGAESFVLKEIFVMEKHRSRGIGTDLMGHFDDIAAHRPKHLTVLATNEDAITLYRRLGYEIMNHPSAQVQMRKA